MLMKTKNRGFVASCQLVDFYIFTMYYVSKAYSNINETNTYVQDGGYIYN